MFLTGETTRFELFMKSVTKVQNINFLLCTYLSTG